MSSKHGKKVELLGGIHRDFLSWNFFFRFQKFKKQGCAQPNTTKLGTFTVLASSYQLVKLQARRSIRRGMALAQSGHKIAMCRSTGREYLTIFLTQTSHAAEIRHYDTPCAPYFSCRVSSPRVFCNPSYDPSSFQRIWIFSVFKGPKNKVALNRT